jgi:hypothetical protein
LDDATPLIEHTVRLIDRTVRVQADRPGTPTPRSDDVEEPAAAGPADPLAELAAALIGQLAPRFVETSGEPTVAD